MTMNDMRLMRWLRIPAAFIASNWAALLAVAVLGLVPAAAGTQRVMARLEHHADEAGAVVLRQLRHTWWRDLPVSLGMLGHLLLLSATVPVVVGGLEGPTRVFFVGLLVPVHWIAAAMFATYVRAAATQAMTATRAEVLEAAISLALVHPVRALLAVVALLAAAPAYVLAPLTIACGMSAPAWALDQVWRARRARSQAAGAEHAVPA